MNRPWRQRQDTWLDLWTRMASHRSFEWTVGRLIGDDGGDGDGRRVDSTLRD